MAYIITTREEYDIVVSRGYEPLIDERFFLLEHGLRVALQHEIFGHSLTSRGNIMQANERFFRWIWAHKPHICEETMRPLREYSAVYCSHILSRGAFPEMAHDPRNINILCFEAHNRWENGDSQRMRIYAKNQQTIERLKKEYNAV